MLKNGTPYRELGPNRFVVRDKAKAAATLVRRNKALGFAVQYQQAAA